MPDAPDHLELPPFPSLMRDGYDRWQGGIDLSFGRGAGLTITPRDPSISRLPSETQRQAMAFHMEHGPDVFAAVLAALLPYYRKMRPRYLDFLGPDANTLMPGIRSPEELRSLIDLRCVHIHPWEKDGIGYVGLQFGCTWDREHGFGVMMHNARVVSTAGADVSFAWAPDEAEASE